MIWVTDTACNVVYISDEWEHLTGQSSADAAGSGWLQVVHPEDRDTAFATLKQATSEEKPFHIKYRLSRATQDYLWVMTGAVPSMSPSGDFIGFLGTVLEAPSDDKADGIIGSFKGVSTIPSAMSHAAIDVIADYLLIAHALARESGERSVIAGLEQCLQDVSQRLAMLDILGPKKSAIN